MSNNFFKNKPRIFNQVQVKLEKTGNPIISSEGRFRKARILENR